MDRSHYDISEAAAGRWLAEIDALAALHCPDPEVPPSLPGVSLGNDGDAESGKLRSGTASSVAK